MSWVNAKIGQLKPSATLAVKARATELKREGRKIIDLSTGEPDMDTPDHIKEAAFAAIRDGKTKYTAVAGILELREVIAEKLRTDNGINATADTVLVTNGGKQALHQIFEVTLNPGDEVIIPSPFWVSYPSMVEIAGGKPVIVQTSPANGYRMTPEELSGAMTEKTKIVVLNSPSNPTGAAYSVAEQQALGAVISDSDVLIISDEVYEKITFGDFEFKSFAAAVPELADRTVTVNAVSKTYSMTGWRVGYATGPQEIIKGMSKLQSQTTSNVSTAGQYAAIAAISGPQDFLKDLVQTFDRRLQMAISLVEKIPGLSVASRPEGAFYLFIRIEDLLKEHGDRFKNSVDVATFFLDEAGVAGVPGEAFGDDGAIRLSVAASDDDVKNGIEQIGAAIAKL